MGSLIRDGLSDVGEGGVTRDMGSLIRDGLSDVGEGGATRDMGEPNS
jgi:hypothetical protein